MNSTWGEEQRAMQRKVKEEEILRSNEKKKYTMQAQNFDKECETKLVEAGKIQKDLSKVRRCADEIRTMWESSVLHYKTHIIDVENSIQEVSLDDQSDTVASVVSMKAWLLKLRLFAALEEKNWQVKWSEKMKEFEMKSHYKLNLTCDEKLLSLQTEHCRTMKTYLVEASLAEDFFTVDDRIASPAKLEKVKLVWEERGKKLSLKYEAARDVLMSTISQQLLKSGENLQRSLKNFDSELVVLEELIRTLQEQHLALFGIEF